MSIPEFNRALKETTSRYNRGMDNKNPNPKQANVSIGLYTIDNAILKYLQTKIHPVVTQDNKQVQVPVIYGNPERWKSVQRDGSIRDKNGKIQLPIIMVRRASMQKNSTNSPVNKYQNYVYKSGWNPRNAYDRFAVVNGIKPSEAYQSIVIPDFYDITYEAIVWTEYMEQMNKLVENISFESDEYWGENNNYKFMAKIGSFEQTNDLPTNSDRIVRNRFNIEVRAYILPESMLNADGNRQSTTRVEYSPKKVVFSSEVISSIDEIK